MNTISAYPLTWPAGFPRTPAHERQRARFGSRHDGYGNRPLTVAAARSRLLEEIRRFTRAGHTWRIDPDDLIISTNVPVRLDGLPRSGAREDRDDPGVAVYLKLDGEDYCFPCDTWDRVADNIAAVAAHLGALRGIERWGVGDLRQAFTGWKALPETVDGGNSWREILGVEVDAGLEDARLAFRRKRSKAHPDGGGDAQSFSEVLQAWSQAQMEFGA